MFASTISEGTGSRDFFGLAQGKRESKYVGFTFGQRAIVHLETNLLIEPEAAANYEAELRAAEEAKRKNEEAQQPQTWRSTKTHRASPGPDRPNQPPLRHVDLNPLLAKKQFAEIIDEVVQNFTTCPNDIVSIVVDIQAVAPAGFDDAIQRAVKENCNALKFRASGV